MTIVSDAFVRAADDRDGRRAPPWRPAPSGERTARRGNGAPTSSSTPQGRLSEARDQLIPAGAVSLKRTRTAASSISPATIAHRGRAAGGARDRHRRPGLIKFGGFPATTAASPSRWRCRRSRQRLRQAVLRPEVFDQVCALFPGSPTGSIPPGVRADQPRLRHGRAEEPLARFVSPDRRPSSASSRSATA